MDGLEGETHVELGADIMHIFGQEWSDFSKYHSRYYAKNDNAKPSKLCFADKLAFSITPWWLYLPFVNLTGEIKEYLFNVQKSERLNWKPEQGQREWHRQLSIYMEKWVMEHIDGSDDTWTEIRHRNVKTKPKKSNNNRFWNKLMFLIICVGGTLAVWIGIILLIKYIIL